MPIPDYAKAAREAALMSTTNRATRRKLERMKRLNPNTLYVEPHEPVSKNQFKKLS